MVFDIILYAFSPILVFKNDYKMWDKQIILCDFILKAIKIYNRGDTYFFA